MHEFLVLVSKDTMKMFHLKLTQTRIEVYSKIKFHVYTVPCNVLQ